jgi:hypothetical protein
MGFPMSCSSEHKIDSRLELDLTKGTYYVDRSKILLQQLTSELLDVSDDDVEQQTLNSTEVLFRNKKVDWQTASTTAGNQGKTRRAATSRASRFFWFIQEPITLQVSCGCSDSIIAGDRGRYERFVRKNARCQKRKREGDDEMNDVDIDGTVIFVS